jgi:hypothetical protein
LTADFRAHGLVEQQEECKKIARQSVLLGLAAP